MSLPVVLALVAVLLVAAIVGARIRYYGRMFSRRHCQAFCEGLARALAAARDKHPHAAPSLDDGTAFVTEAGLAVAVSCSPGSGGCTLHLSLSQPGAQTTTRAVAGRFGFLALAMLRGNRCELSPFRMPSGVHHLVLRMASPDFSVATFADAYAAYLADYRPIPYASRRDDAQ